MTAEDISIIVGAAVTILSGSKLWDYLRRKRLEQARDRATDRKETHLYRDDLRERVKELESKLEEAQKKITELASQCSALKAKVEILEALNADYKSRLASQDTPTLQTALDSLSFDEDSEEG